MRALTLLLGMLCCGVLLFAQEPERYQLEGKLLQEDDQPFRGRIPQAFIRSTAGIFEKATLVGPGGGFKFKKLVPGLYTLVLSVPGHGQTQYTVEIGPSSADKKRRIKSVFYFVPERRISAANTVSASQLTIPQKAFDLIAKAQKRLEKEDGPGARELLSKAVEVAPNYANAWNLMGTIDFRTEQFASAEVCFREALKHDPSYYAPLVNLGAVLLTQGKLEEALTKNQAAVDERPDDPLSQSQLGQTYFRMGSLKEAEEHLKTAKSLDPRHFSLPRLFLAEIYRLRNDLTSRIIVLEEFLEYHPDSRFSEPVREVLRELKSRNPR